VSQGAPARAGDAGGAAAQPVGAFHQPAHANGGGGAPAELSDARLLPFPRGALSFGAGIGLKLAVTRWANWASDAGLRDARTGAPLTGAEEGCGPGAARADQQSRVLILGVSGLGLELQNKLLPAPRSAAMPYGHAGAAGHPCPKRLVL